MATNEGEETANLKVQEGISVTIYDGGNVHMCSVSIVGTKCTEHDDFPDKMSRCDDLDSLP